MPSYKAPLDDMRFVLNEVLGVSKLSRFKEFESLDDATINSFLTEVAKMAEDVLFPLNQSGDHEGCKHDRDAKTVTTPKGFKEAYQQFCAAGLPGFASDPKYGGLGMPIVMNTALSEMFCSANMSFGMYPGLSHGAYNALYEYGSDAQKNLYLPKIVSGEWTGTMCLTEPHCGTDLALIKTKAVAQGDGRYSISGTKIFISAGEHDMSQNIVHLVLARIDNPSTPPGIKGISLFLVPKFIPDDQGNPGERNKVYCGRIEEKMGIHANSTCEMNFEGATGWLIGEAHKGMRAMFVMMNEARLGVGLQGLGLSEVAYQNGLAYALDRKQGLKIDDMGEEAAARGAVPIISHADVRRELLTAKAQIEGARMLAYWASMQLDIAHHGTDESEKKRAKKLVDLLTPILKAHLTDNAVDHTNSAMQVFGGHGYIKEWGVEQYNRDARITRIYEGTNAIQALDLIGRKIMKEGLLPGYLALVKSDLSRARRAGVPSSWLRGVSRHAGQLGFLINKLRLRAALARFGVGSMAAVMRDAAAMSTDVLKILSLVSLGHMWAKMAAVAAKKRREHAFYDAKMKTAEFYFKKVMPMAETHVVNIAAGGDSVYALAPEDFLRGQGTIGEKTL
jgi:hypothetical protein